MSLTELEAATAYARAWNRLDCSEFVKLLAPEARYASQWVFEELVGVEAITDYLVGKMQAVKDSHASVRAEMAVTTKSFPGRDCVVLTQGDQAAVVIFEIKDGAIKRFDLCIPAILKASRSGEYPT